MANEPGTNPGSQGEDRRSDFSHEAITSASPCLSFHSFEVIQRSLRCTPLCRYLLKRNADSSPDCRRLRRNRNAGTQLRRRLSPSSATAWWETWSDPNVPRPMAGMFAPLERIRCGTSAGSTVSAGACRAFDVIGIVRTFQKESSLNRTRSTQKLCEGNFQCGSEIAGGMVLLR